MTKVNRFFAIAFVVFLWVFAPLVSGAKAPPPRLERVDFR